MFSFRQGYEISCTCVRACTRPPPFKKRDSTVGTSYLVLNLSSPGDPSGDPVSRRQTGTVLLLAPALGPTPLTLPSARSWATGSHAPASSGLGMFSPGLWVQPCSNFVLFRFPAPFAGFTGPEKSQRHWHQGHVWVLWNVSHQRGALFNKREHTISCKTINAGLEGARASEMLCCLDSISFSVNLPVNRTLSF